MLIWQVVYDGLRDWCSSCCALACNMLMLQVVYDGLRSPTEYESTPIIAHVLQEYFLRLMGRYRDFIQPEGAARAATGAAPAEEQANAGQAVMPTFYTRVNYDCAYCAYCNRASAFRSGCLYPACMLTLCFSMQIGPSRTVWLLAFCLA